MTAEQKIEVLERIVGRKTAAGQTPAGQTLAE